MRYQQPVANDQLKQMRGLNKLWDAVRRQAHYSSFKLVAVKSKFTSLAQLEISDFAAEIHKLCIQYTGWAKKPSPVFVPISNSKIYITCVMHFEV